MKDYMVDIICIFLELCIDIVGFSAIMGTKLRPHKYLPLLLLFFLVNPAFSFLPYDAFVTVSVLTFQVILILYIIFSYKVSLIDALCINGILYFTVILCEMLTVLICSVFRIDATGSYFGIMGNIAVLLMVLLLYQFKILNKLFFPIVNDGFIGKAIILNLYLFALLIILYQHIGITSVYERVLFFISLGLVLLLFNILFSNQVRKIKIQDAKISAYDEYLPILEELILTVRVRQHNYSNRLQAIAGLIYTNKDYESLSRALKEQFEIATDSDLPEFLLKVNMMTVAGFLYQKMSEAEKMNKKLDIKFNTYNLASDVPEYEIIEMFGILIDNALEAVREQATVYVYIDSLDGMIIFKTRNEGRILTAEDREKFFAKGYSKKPDGAVHSGLGLYQLNNLIKKYNNASISLWNEENDILFEVKI